MNKLCDKAAIEARIFTLPSYINEEITNRIDLDGFCSLIERLRLGFSQSELSITDPLTDEEQDAIAKITCLFRTSSEIQKMQEWMNESKETDTKMEKVG